MSAAERITEVAARLQPVGTDVVLAPQGAVETPITGGEMEVLYRLARGLAASRMFKDAVQADQAFARLIFGRDLGLSATQAMTDIYIVEGKPEMSANLQAAKIRSSSRYEYVVDQLDDEGCEISFYDEDRDVLLGVSKFGAADAQKAGLAGKDNFKKYPRNMFFARALSNGCAWYCPDVMNGIRVYAVGELQDTIRTQDSPIAAAEPPEAEVVEADVVPIDPRALNTQEREQLAAALEAANLSAEDLSMLLVAVGVDCTDDLTKANLDSFRELLGQRIAAGGKP